MCEGRGACVNMCVRGKSQPDPPHSSGAAPPGSSGMESVPNSRGMSMSPSHPQAMSPNFCLCCWGSISDPAALGRGKIFSKPSCPALGAWKTAWRVSAARHPRHCPCRGGRGCGRGQKPRWGDTECGHPAGGTPRCSQVARCHTQRPERSGMDEGMLECRWDWDGE